MLIIKAGHEHYDSLVELNKLIHLDIPDFKWDTKEYIMGEISDGRCYVVLEKGKVIGSMSFTEMDNCGCIDKILVDRNSQGKGIGKALVDLAAKISKDLKKEELLVGSFSEYGASGFYTRCGFEWYGALDDGRGNWSDNFSMRLG